MTTETPNKPRTETLTIGVGGMTCASCVSRVERALKKVPGVGNATVNLATEKATVSYDCDITPVDTLLGAIEGAGYDALRESMVLDVLSDAFEAAALRSALQAVQGVTEVDVSVEARRVSVSFPAGAVDVRQLRKAAEAAGIEIKEREQATDEGAEDTSRREQRMLVAKWVTAGIAGALMMAAEAGPVLDQIESVISVQTLLVLMFVVALPIQVWAGWQFYVGAWKTARHRDRRHEHADRPRHDGGVFLQHGRHVLARRCSMQRWRRTTMPLATGRPSTSRRR